MFTVFTRKRLLPSSFMCQSFHWDLPVELWRDIFACISDHGDLSNVSAACRFFQLEAEAVLYRTIELERSADIVSLALALTSRPARAPAVRALTVRRLGSDHLHTLNEVLRALPALKSLHIQSGFRPELVLAGCTFQLTQLTALFGPDSRAFHPFLAGQHALEDLDAGNLCRIFSAPRRGLLPRLRKLRASHEAIAQLGPEQVRNITHLAVSVAAPAQFREVLRVFGPQLVSLSIAKPSGVDSTGYVLGLTQAALPRLVFLEFIEKKFLTSSLTEYPPLARHGLSAKTFVWNINCDNKVKDAEIWERRYANIRRFAETVLRGFPAPERFVYVMKNSHIVCTLGEGGSMLEREDKSMYYGMWRDVRVPAT